MSYLKIIMRFLFAFFIFYMSSGWLSNYVFVAMAAGCLICVSGFSFLKVSEKDDLVFLLFIVLACLNLAFHTELLQSPIQISSIAIGGYYLTYKLAKNTKMFDLKLFTYFSALESIVLIVSSVRSFVHAMAEIPVLGWHQGLLHFYQTRGCGLLGSVGLSGFALLTGFLFLEYGSSYFSSREKHFLYPVLSIGLVLNMSRAAVLSLFIFFAIKFLPRITWSCREFQRRYVIWGMLLFFGALIWGYRFFGSVDLSELSSGRTVIYQNALHYIYEHPLFGMGSWRYYDFSYVAEGIHAHNSYLELWATHGAISLILMGFIAKQIGPKNYLYLIPIFIFGLMNFSIFYVFSFGDIVMFYFLSTPQRKPAS